MKRWWMTTCACLLAGTVGCGFFSKNLGPLPGEDQHGYGIMQEVLDRTSGKVRLWPATLYGTLKRLMDEELIEESGERPAPELDDSRRRYYRLTTEGRRVLALQRKKWQAFVGAVGRVAGVEHA